MEFIAILYACVCNRIRGGYPEGRPKWLARIFMYQIGGAMAVLVTDDLRLILAASALTGLVAWRQNTGWRGTFVRGNPHLVDALAFGALWAVPMAVFAYWDRDFLLFLIAAPLGFTFAAYLATKMPVLPVLDLRNAWPWAELMEMGFCGAVVVALLALGV